MGSALMMASGHVGYKDCEIMCLLRSFFLSLFLMRFLGDSVFAANCPVDVFDGKDWPKGVTQFDAKPSIASLERLFVK